MEWFFEQKCIRAFYPNGSKPQRNPYPSSTKIAGFDLDMTLIRTKSGRMMPKSRDDWMWWNDAVPKKLKLLVTEGYMLVIFTNQNCILLQSQRMENFKAKLDKISVQVMLDIPLALYVAPSADQFRKPEIAMWELMLADNNIPKGGIFEAFYVGDAAGRDGDWADSDKAFALNAGIQFHTPEDFFLQKQVEEIISDVLIEVV